jgi:hypothetical protein
VQECRELFLFRSWFSPGVKKPALGGLKEGSAAATTNAADVLNIRFSEKCNRSLAIHFILATIRERMIFNIGDTMSSANKHGWKWAYHKLRGLHCSRPTALYRATRFIFWGDTGTFISEDNWQKIRLRR